MITDIASILFACVAANHLGLISAMERVIKVRLWVVDCPKCLTFWTTLIYCCGKTATHQTDVGVVGMLAIAFLNAYLALWVELGMGVIDCLYNKVYEKIYEPSDNDTFAADPDDGDSAGPVSELRKGCDAAKDNN